MKQAQITAERNRTAVTLERVGAAASQARTYREAFGLDNSDRENASRVLDAACAVYRYAHAHGQAPEDQLIRLAGTVVAWLDRVAEAEEHRVDLADDIDGDAMCFRSEGPA